MSSRHVRRATSWIRSCLTLVWTLVAAVCATLSAQDAGGVPGAATASGATTGPGALIGRTCHWIGDGVYQCEGAPSAIAINPGGTAVVAMIRFIADGYSIFSIPDGHPLLVPHTRPSDGMVEPIGRVRWMDDHRFIYSGRRNDELMTIQEYGFAIEITVTSR